MQSGPPSGHSYKGKGGGESKKGNGERSQETRKKVKGKRVNGKGVKGNGGRAKCKCKGDIGKAQRGNPPGSDSPGSSSQLQPSQPAQLAAWQHQLFQLRAGFEIIFLKVDVIKKECHFLFHLSFKSVAKTMFF